MFKIRPQELNTISTKELIWGSYHLSLDEKEIHDKIQIYLDVLLSFINPELFTKYKQQRTNTEEIVNEAYEEEIRSKTGLSLEEFKNLSNPDLDIIGEPIYIKE